MDFRRSGQLDERRRRVLMDEIAPAGEGEKPAPTGSKGPVRAYHENVLADRQRRVSEFIPVRPFKVIALILLLLTAVAAIEALYIFTAPPGGHLASLPKPPLAKAPNNQPRSTEHAFAALDLAARGNLGSYFSSLLFAGGTLTILGLLSIRAHRVDDYRGRYRIWWWVAAAFAFASVDTGTGLHDTLGEAGQILAGDSIPGGRTLLWIGAYGLVFGTLGIRAAFEIWSSLTAVTFGSLAALLYFAGIAIQLEVVPLETGVVLRTVLASSLTLLAHVSLVSAVVVFARHVHLDAQGRLMVSADPAAKPKKKSKSKAKLAVVADDEEEETKPAAKDKKAEAKKEEAKKDDAKKEDAKKEAAVAAKPAASPAPAIKFGSASAPAASASISAKAAAKPVAQSDDEDEEVDEDEDMSRSDRKRLKKLARREQQQQRRAA